MLRSFLLAILTIAALTLGCCESILMAQLPTDAGDRPIRALVVQPSRVALKITVDASEAPELQEWGDKAKAICEQQYPIICEMLASEGFVPRDSIKIVFKGSMGAPAATGGDTISVNAPYVTQHPDDYGMMVHELVHVVQRYGRGNAGGRNMGWMTEGIADWVRWHKYEPGMDKSRIDPAKASYRDSYRTTARFLAYVNDTYDKELVKKLNALMRQGKCSEASFKDIVGKDVEELWKEFLGTLDERGRPKREQDSTTQKSKEAAGPRSLAFSVYRSGANARNAKSGLVSACWDDGLIIFALDPRSPGEDLQCGTLTQAQMRRALDEIWAAGLLDIPSQTRAVPDGGSTTITLTRDGKHVAHAWHESLPGPSQQGAADEDYRRFAKIWMVSRAIIAFSYPSEYKPIDEVPGARERLDATHKEQAFWRR